MLAQVAPLYLELFSVCSNGVIPNLKSVTALSNCHAADPVHQSKDNMGSWAPTASGLLRMVSHHYRDLAMYPEKLETCLKKAWGFYKK